MTTTRSPRRWLCSAAHEPAVLLTSVDGVYTHAPGAVDAMLISEGADARTAAFRARFGARPRRDGEQGAGRRLAAAAGDRDRDRERHRKTRCSARSSPARPEARASAARAGSASAYKLWLRFGKRTATQPSPSTTVPARSSQGERAGKVGVVGWSPEFRAETVELRGRTAAVRTGVSPQSMPRTSPAGRPTSRRSIATASCSSEPRPRAPVGTSSVYRDLEEEDRPRTYGNRVEVSGHRRGAAAARSGLRHAAPPVVEMRRVEDIAVVVVEVVTGSGRTRRIALPRSNGEDDDQADVHLLLLRLCTRSLSGARCHQGRSRESRAAEPQLAGLGSCVDVRIADRGAPYGPPVATGEVGSKEV